MWSREFITSSDLYREMGDVTDKDDLAGRTEDKYLDKHPFSKRKVKQEVLDFLSGEKKLPDDLFSLIKSAKTDYDLNHSKLLAPKKEHTTLDGIGAQNPITYEENRKPFPAKRRGHYEI